MNNVNRLTAALSLLLLVSASWDRERMMTFDP